MTIQKITVISAVIQQKNALIYTKNGDILIYPSSDPDILSLITRIHKGFIDEGKNEVYIYLSSEQKNPWMETEKKSRGVLKFFAIAKKKLAAILGKTVERGDVNAGGFVTNHPDAVSVQPGIEPLAPEILRQLQRNNIIKTLTNNNQDDVSIVAVVDNVPIPNIENLKSQMILSNQIGNSAGFSIFMKLFANMASKRKHTTQELLEFMKLNNLPITADGHILAYKSLTRQDDVYWVDNHTKTIKQKLGSIVSMDSEMIDDNRRVLCSNGLHIATPHYLKRYGNARNNDIFIVKIHPHDVISVPMGEKEKIRVSKYHIIYKLSDNMKERFSNQTLFSLEKDDPESLILSNLVQGKDLPHTHIAHQNKNKTITYSDIPHSVTASDPVPVIQKENPDSKISKKVTTTNKENNLSNNNNLNPEKINKSKTQKHIFRYMFDKFEKETNINKKKQLANQVYEFKRKSKKSYASLGLTHEQIDSINFHCLDN